MVAYVYLTFGSESVIDSLIAPQALTAEDTLVEKMAPHRRKTADAGTPATAANDKPDEKRKPDDKPDEKRKPDDKPDEKKKRKPDDKPDEKKKPDDKPDEKKKRKPDDKPDEKKKRKPDDKPDEKPEKPNKKTKPVPDRVTMP